MDKNWRDIPMPHRIKALPVDHRGFPVPVMAAYKDGKPDLAVIDAEKCARMIRTSLCGICGQPLGRYKFIVGGPKVWAFRVSANPAFHSVCAEYAMKVCPHLATPSMPYLPDRPDDTIALRGMDTVRAPYVGLFVTERYNYEVSGGMLLITAITWTKVEWWSEGMKELDMVHANNASMRHLIERVEADQREQSYPPVYASRLKKFLEDNNVAVATAGDAPRGQLSLPM